MENFKQMIKTVWKNIWATLKQSFLASVMYTLAGMIMMMMSLRNDKVEWTSGTTVLFVVAILCAAAYNGLLMYGVGGKGYEMLVSGNMKRRSAEQLGMEYKISSHKEEQEYRVWKGFVCGLWSSVFIVVCSLVLGANQAVIDAGKVSENVGLIVVNVIAMFVVGWVMYPLYFANYTKVAAVSYYYGILFILIPILVSGVCYILGAYGRRNKAIKEQEMADRAAKAEANKVKKINYGGLPGTKPRKQK